MKRWKGKDPALDLLLQDLETDLVKVPALRRPDIIHITTSSVCRCPSGNCEACFSHEQRKPYKIGICESCFHNTFLPWAIFPIEKYPILSLLKCTYVCEGSESEAHLTNQLRLSDVCFQIFRAPSLILNKNGTLENYPISSQKWIFIDSGGSFLHGSRKGSLFFFLLRIQLPWLKHEGDVKDRGKRVPCPVKVGLGKSQ